MVIVDITFYDNGVYIVSKSDLNNQSHLLAYIEYPEDKDTRYKASAMVHEFIRENEITLFLDEIEIRPCHKTGRSPFKGESGW